MCFICKKNNKQTKKPVNLFWQDGAKAGIQTFTEINSAKHQGMDCRQGYGENM